MYRNFKIQIGTILTEREFKKAHIAICTSYSNYELSHTEFMSLRDMLIAKRTQRGFAWGAGI